VVKKVREMRSEKGQGEVTSISGSGEKRMRSG
jgi:hypothetical protein